MEEDIGEQKKVENSLHLVLEVYFHSYTSVECDGKLKNYVKELLKLRPSLLWDQ